MNKTKQKNLGRERRHRRIRAKVKGAKERPRLAVFKSNKYIYAQLIDDENGVTLAHASSQGVKKGTMLQQARETGVAIAKLAKEKKITKVTFDRGGFMYTGKIRAVAEGAREGGLKF